MAICLTIQLVYGIHSADYKPTRVRVFGTCLEERADEHCNQIDDKEDRPLTVVNRYLGQKLFLVCAQTNLGKRSKNCST